MGLETGTVIEDLDQTWPLGTDPKSQGDDHIRLVKTCVQGSFPNLGAPGVADTVLTSDGVDVSWQPGSAVLPGYITGFRLVNSTAADVTSDIQFDPGACTDNKGDVLMVSDVGIIKDLKTFWAEGSNAGGFPSTGITLTVETWYRCFAIGKPDGQVDFGFDTDINAVNLLADAIGYTTYRRVGWIRYQTGNAIKRFRQFNDFYTWRTMEIDVSDTSPGTGRNVAAVLGAPSQMVQISALLSEGASVSVWVGSTSLSNVATSAANYSSQIVVAHFLY